MTTTEFLKLSETDRAAALSTMSDTESRELHREMASDHHNAVAWTRACDRLHRDQVAAARGVVAVATPAPVQTPVLVTDFLALSHDERVAHLGSLSEDDSRKLHRAMLAAGHEYSWAQAAEAL